MVTQCELQETCEAPFPSLVKVLESSGKRMRLINYYPNYLKINIESTCWECPLRTSSSLNYLLLSLVNI